MQAVQIALVIKIFFTAFLIRTTSQPANSYLYRSVQSRLTPTIVFKRWSEQLFNDAFTTLSWNLLPEILSSKMARKRRPPRPGALNEHSPLKIFTQIVIVQIVYYLSALALIIFSALVAGKRFSLDLVFDWHSLRGDTTVGWMLGVIWVLNSFTGIILMLVLVRRSKLVLDFALTLHFIHLLTVSLYSHSLPRNVTWWATQFISAGAIIFMGVWSCQWRELRPISFGADTSASRSSTALGNLINSGNKENEAGSKGRKSKIAEPAESFEMVGMMSNDLEMEP